MKSYAVIEQKPIKTKVITITRVQDVNPILTVNSIQQPKPYVVQEQNIHVIDRRRSKSSGNINAPAPVPERQHEISTQHQKTIKQRKPIFKNHKQAQQSIVDSMHLAESIKLSQTSAMISESSQKYYLTAGHRKMKGSPQPYSKTHRVKDKEKRAFERQSEPDIRILSPEVVEREENQMKNFKKKKIFSEAKTQKKVQDDNFLVVGPTTQKKKKIFQNKEQIEEQIKQIKQPKKRPQFIPLRPKGYKERMMAKSVYLSATSSSQSLQVFSFQPMRPMIL